MKRSAATAERRTADDESVAAARRRHAERFRAAGLDTPDLDARILVGHALSLDHAGLAAHAGRVLDAAEGARIEALARRRLAREPVARIVGRKEFWSLSLRVDPSALVPRPETETVVEAALAALTDDARGGPLLIADLGTGSGALLLALLSELPSAFGIGTDISTAALALASDNARALLPARAAFVATDMAAALAGRFDLIVSNPPYIASAAIAALSPEVREFDPHLALDGGHDGLDAYRTVATAAARLLRPGAALVVELGAGQAGPVADRMSAAGLTTAPPRRDLAGHARTLTARRPVRDQH